MMSSEEETDCFASYGDKLSKKAKRARQRVDAGEPRNSYSSIPNFTSRPGFMSGGIYGAIFNQNRQHFGPFAPGYAPAKMLNELLGRGGEDVPEDARGSPELAHRMLRDILQGRKEFMRLERELRAASLPDVDRDNNNGELADCDTKREDSGDEAAAAAMRECLQEAGLADERQRNDLMEEAMMTVDGDSRSLTSPASASDGLVAPKLEPDTDAPHSSDKERSPLPPKDMKRERVENIVSSMRSSPVPTAPSTQPQVNGCKKRKLYHPQQHDNGAAERYAAGLGLALDLHALGSDDEDDDADRPPIQQKLVEKNALKSQLRSMQEQLAEMQQKYVQLCSRMEQDSETQDEDDVTEIEHEASPTVAKSSPASSPHHKETSPAMKVQNGINTPDVLSQVMSKMMSAKVHPHMQHPHVHGLPPGFNGALPLMPHMQHRAHPHHHRDVAAVYLGVSQKMFMEREARLAKEVHDQHHQQQQQQQQQPHHQARQPPSPEHRQPVAPGPKPVLSADLAERLHAMRDSNSVGPVSGADLEGLAEVLKTEITSSLASLIDSIVTRFVHQRRFVGKQSEAAAAAAEQLNKDLMLASQLLERKSPRPKPAERPPGPLSGNAPNHQSIVPISMPNGVSNGIALMSHTVNHVHPVVQMNGPLLNGSHVNGPSYPPVSVHGVPCEPPGGHDLSHQIPHTRPPPAAMFQTPKPPHGLSPAAAVALYGSLNGVGPFCMPEREQNPEQNEALSLVVTPKKKRHKVTDTRITPRTVSRILAQDGVGPPPAPEPSKPFADSPSPRPYHAPPPMSLPTSVAIPNPSLHESQVFSPYSPFFAAAHHAHAVAHAAPHGRVQMPPTRSPPCMEARISPPAPMTHAPAMLHPALLAARRASPDYRLDRLDHLDQLDRLDRLDRMEHDQNSDCNSTELAYNGAQPTISFSYVHSSTLTPMHLRKAKLMFFWVRYPSSAVLKMYFPDIKFNKNNTAQLVKWFSNFREFYYIQMEKYARQAISEGMKNADELHVAGDSEIYRVLNLHYNRNNHIEVRNMQVPTNFRYVVEQTLREFFRAIQGGKDTEQSWKKSIYKVISRLDDPVPEYFKSPNFLEQLE